MWIGFKNWLKVSLETDFGWISIIVLEFQTNIAYNIRRMLVAGVSSWADGDCILLCFSFHPWY